MDRERKQKIFKGLISISTAGIADLFIFHFALDKFMFLSTASEHEDWMNGTEDD